MSEKITKSDAEWRAALTPEQYRILREKGTERAFYRRILANQDPRRLPLLRLRRRTLLLRCQVRLRLRLAQLRPPGR